MEVSSLVLLFKVSLLLCILRLIKQEYFFGSTGISALQIYTYFESTISVYTENILSTLLKSLIQSFSVHWPLWSTLPGVYLFTKSLHNKTSITVRFSTQFTILNSLFINLKSLAEYPVQAQNWCSLELRLFTVEMLQYQCLHFSSKD